MVLGCQDKDQVLEEESNRYLALASLGKSGSGMGTPPFKESKEREVRSQRHQGDWCTSMWPREAQWTVIVWMMAETRLIAQ